jgi:polyisoprenoid-binding protein YceI
VIPLKWRSTIPLFFILYCVPLAAQTAPASLPVFEIAPEGSSITFFVKSSISIKGTFDKWEAKLSFASPDPTTGVLDIKVQANSVNSGSGITNSTMMGKKFFNAKENPLITFKSTKIVQHGPDTFEVEGLFTIRGVAKSETMTMTVTDRTTGNTAIKGQLAFNRKHYGMHGGVPFVRIDDRVEVDVNLREKRVNGPTLDVKQF